MPHRMNTCKSSAAFHILFSLYKGHSELSAAEQPIHIGLYKKEPVFSNKSDACFYAGWYYMRILLTWRRHRMKGTIMKGIVITAVIVLSIASGYCKGKKKLASLVALGVILGIYVGVYLMNQ